MPLQPIEFSSLDDLYRFVDSAANRTGLILDSAAQFRPWARAVAAECHEVEWSYPAQPMPANFLEHLTNLAHVPVVEKGFVLLEKGRIVRAIDVDAIHGSSEPMRLTQAVKKAFEPDVRTRTKDGPRTRTKVHLTIEEAYSVLGAAASESNQEIKSKYKSLILQYHPDRVAHLGPELIDLAVRKTKEINAAYESIRKNRG